MGVLLISGAGGGADLDAVTAKSDDVRTGKVIVGPDGEPLTGTMPEQIGSTITPGTLDKTVVAANRYVTGDVIVKGDANLLAANIKKGATIFGVKGTWDGYVVETYEAYSSGYNRGNITISTDCISFQSDHIHTTAKSISSGTAYMSMEASRAGMVGFKKYKYLNMNVTVVRHYSTSSNVTVWVYRGIGSSAANSVAGSTVSISEGNKATIKVDLKQFNTEPILYFGLHCGNETYLSELKISRIWLTMS